MPWVDVHTEVEIRLTRSCFRTYKAGSQHNVPRHVAGKIVYLNRAGTFSELDTLGRPLRKGGANGCG